MSEDVARSRAVVVRLAAATTFLIAVLDAMQPLLLPWRPKFVATIAGAVLYFALSTLIATKGHRVALAITALMPIVPLCAVVGRLVGLNFPVDPAMLAIFACQVLAAGFASLSLKR